MYKYDKEFCCTKSFNQPSRPQCIVHDLPMTHTATICRLMENEPQFFFLNLFLAYFIELQCAGTVLTCFSIHQNTWCLCLTTCKTTRRYYLSNRVFCVHFYFQFLNKDFPMRVCVWGFQVFCIKV